MTLDFTNLNWVAIIVAAAVTVALGFIWYLPQVLGRRWATAAGISLPDSGEVSPVLYLGAVVQALVAAYVLALFMNAMGASSIVDGVIVGVVAWIGFVGVAGLDAVLFEKKSTEYWLITSGYRLVSLVLMGGIIGYLSA